MPEPAVLWWPSFDSLWHGGGHRSAQLREVFEEAGLALRVVAPVPRSGRLMRAWSALRRRLGPALEDRATLRAHRDAGERARVLLWETTTRPRRAAVAHGLGLHVVAFPHNLESLVPAGLFAARDVHAGFRRELRGLRNSAHVVTIAPDEAWLLRLFGVSATCLPYHPPDALRTRFEAVRAAREPATEREFLLLGSHGNPPTRQGTTEVLSMLAAMPCAGRRFVVAGERSDALAASPHPHGTQFRGRVSDRELDDVLARAAALIVHQPATTGTVTRITEALYAGVPVIANEYAARGFETMEGVHVYRRPEELARWLERPLPTPAPPPRPRDAEREVVERVRTLGAVR